MTFEESTKLFYIKLGIFFREVGKAIQPDYWACTYCGQIEYVERETRCWECGKGEMVYKGDIIK